MACYRCLRCGAIVCDIDICGNCGHNMEDE